MLLQLHSNSTLQSAHRVSYIKHSPPSSLEGWVDLGWNGIIVWTQSNCADGSQTEVNPLWADQGHGAWGLRRRGGT